MCKVNDHIKRKKKDVDPPFRKPNVNPNTKGNDIILEEN